MTAVEASRYYESKVGWQADARPGDEVYVNSNGERGAYDETKYGGRTPRSNIIVIGRNEALSDSFWSNFDRQGGPLSLALNIVPGMNATGHLHDWWFNSGAILNFNFATNFGTMIPAATVTYSAVLGNHLDGWHQNSTSWNYISRSQRQPR